MLANNRVTVRPRMDSRSPVFMAAAIGRAVTTGVGPELACAAITILATVAMVNSRLVLALAGAVVRTIRRTARSQA
jgi:hypothetical protein